MPLLARMVSTPIVVDIRPGALDDLASVLDDGRISSGGRIAVASSPVSGAAIAADMRGQLDSADFFTVSSGTVDAAVRLVEEARHGSYDAIVGIGGGRVLDVTKFAAARLGLPMVSVATNLAHDGIGSPVSILDNDAGRGSYGVPAPLAVIVDLDVVRRAPPRSVRAGVGEALSNLSAVRDWQLAHAERGETVDGLALMLARSAGESVLHHPDGLASDAFLATLAESLVLSGLAMVVAGTSRPCSGACHEISHAMDLRAPGRGAYHGEQVGLGAAFATWLRRDLVQLDRMVSALRRHGLPVVPADLGLDHEQFADFVAHAPQTRPGRHTILEQLALDDDQILASVEAYVETVGT